MYQCETLERRSTSLDRTMWWLQELLEDGPIPAAELWELADANGMKRDTVRAAKRELDIPSLKTKGPRGYWIWTLPNLRPSTLRR